MRKCHIRKNDMVKVLSGRDTGKTGRVLRVLRSEGKAIVERVNFVKKHVRPNPQKNVKGGIMEREAPIDVSSLRVVCSACGQSKGFSINVLEDGRKVRICKVCGDHVSRSA